MSIHGANLVPGRSINFLVINVFVLLLVFLSQNIGTGNVHKAEIEYLHKVYAWRVGIGLWITGRPSQNLALLVVSDNGAFVLVLRLSLEDSMIS